MTINGPLGSNFDMPL